MTAIECFWVQESGEAELSLRRYISGTDCGSHGYCDESVTIGRQPLRRTDDGYIAHIPPLEHLDDPRWPAACSRCGRVFGPLDELDGIGRMADGMGHTQVNQKPIYRAADGREWRTDRLPPGAMFDAIWQRDQAGADGISLIVVTPYEGRDARSGFWHVDGPATGDGRLVPHAWSRVGDPRTPGSVTANPSILTGCYHGWLRNGTLVPA